VTVAARREAAAHVFVDDLQHPQLDDLDAHHISRVLRLRDGERVVASDGVGGWRWCTYRSGGVLEVDGAIDVEPPARPTVGVGFALPKGDRPEWIVQKLTELGVDRIVPFVSARTVVRWDGERAGRQAERLRRVVREAAMQSRQVRLPQLDEPCSFAEVAGQPGVCLAEPGGDEIDRTDTLVLVGPEGGFTADELAGGRRTVALPGGVLRTETAAVTAGVILVMLRSRG
jgi:16S rRNA (uracil1498-N3)-methyltransferase